jgi:hypothetical protein
MEESVMRKITTWVLVLCLLLGSIPALAEEVWEDGLLIASGGKLQYYNGTTLVTLSDSPDACTSVYTRAGRVVVTTANEVRYSGVGDETNWSEDSGDYSASVWVEAGYKDGGKFVGMASLSQDMLIFKDNRRVYRLSGEYPDWSIVEVSRNVECLGRTGFVSIANTVIVLGKNEVQAMQPTSDYGDVKPEGIGAKVTKELSKLTSSSRVRFVPPLSQVWFIGSQGNVLVLDTNHNAWFKRKFNSVFGLRFPHTNTKPQLLCGLTSVFLYVFKERSLVLFSENPAFKMQRCRGGLHVFQNFFHAHPFLESHQ